MSVVLIRTTLVRSLARFQSLPRRIACRDVPSATRFLRTDHYVEIWPRLHFWLLSLGWPVLYPVPLRF